MFEKEAEENKPPYAYCSLNTNCELWKYGFQKGAELSYNKAKKDADKMKSRFLELCNLKDMRIAELENANKWHYVKDGDLPKEDDVYLVYTTKGVLLGHYEQGGADGETDFTGEPYSDFTEYPSEMLFTEDEIIAWKEIVLPKEIE